MELQLSQQHECRPVKAVHVVCWNQQEGSFGWERGTDFAQRVNSHVVVNWEDDHSSEMGSAKGLASRPVAALPNAVSSEMLWAHQLQPAAG